jgi:hypothetical protein
MAKCTGTAEEISEKNSPVTQSAPAALGNNYTEPMKTATAITTAQPLSSVAPTFRSTSKDDVFLSMEQVAACRASKRQASIEVARNQTLSRTSFVGSTVQHGGPQLSMSHAQLKASASRFFETLAKNPKLDASKMVHNYEEVWQKFQDCPKYD